MAAHTQVDTELLAWHWTHTTPVAALVTREPGKYNIFRAMPIGSPLPSVVLSRVGGAPPRRSDMPLDVARISFDCWAADRTTAADIARELVGACENLSQAGAYTHAAGILLAAEVVSHIWVPDPESDTPRYVVDAMFTSIPG
ncbi:MAG: DUF3168 domain-containing protein [Actinomycetota bacterium]|nr:DUF3168 domain-containing protein [Actinomycetota bacterium]